MVQSLGEMSRLQTIIVLGSQDSLLESPLLVWASQVALVVKNPPADVRDMRHGFDPWDGKIPWRRAWQPTPAFLPEESHRQRSLVGYSPYSHTE